MLTSGWNEVATGRCWPHSFHRSDDISNINDFLAVEVPPVDVATVEVPILDAEPDISAGVAGALKMAISKGYIHNENEKRPSASRFAHLQAQNYSIEDKAYTLYVFVNRIPDVDILIFFML